MLTALSLYMVYGQESYSRFPTANAAGTPIGFHDYPFERLPSNGAPWSVAVMLLVTLHPTRIALLTQFAAWYRAALATAIAQTCLLTLSCEPPMCCPLFGAAGFTGLLWRDDGNLGAVDAQALGHTLALPFSIVGFPGFGVFQWHGGPLKASSDFHFFGFHSCVSRCASATCAGSQLLGKKV